MFNNFKEFLAILTPLCEETENVRGKFVENQPKYVELLEHLEVFKTDEDEKSKVYLIPLDGVTESSVRLELSSRAHDRRFTVNVNGTCRYFGTSIIELKKMPRTGDEENSAQRVLDTASVTCNINVDKLENLLADKITEAEELRDEVYSKYEIFNDVMAFMGGDESKSFVKQDPLAVKIIENELKIVDLKKDLDEYRAILDEEVEEMTIVGQVRALNAMVYKLKDTLRRRCNETFKAIYSDDYGYYRNYHDRTINMMRYAVDFSNADVMETVTDYESAKSADDFIGFLANNKNYTAVKRARNLLNWIQKTKMNPLEFYDGFRETTDVMPRGCNINVKDLFHARLENMIKDSGLSQVEFFNLMVQNATNFTGFRLEEPQPIEKIFLHEIIFQSDEINIRKNDISHKEQQKFLSDMEEKYNVTINLRDNSTVQLGLQIKTQRTDRMLDDIQRAFELMPALLDIYNAQTGNQMKLTEDGKLDVNDGDTLNNVLEDILDLSLPSIGVSFEPKAGQLKDEYKGYHDLLKEI